MKNSQKIGGIAALIGAATNLFALVTYIAFLAPTGYGSDDPSKIVAFLADNQAILRAWYILIYLVFGVSLILLALALHERLKYGSPVLVQAVTTFGMVYAVLVIMVGTLEISNLSTIVKLFGDNPSQAATTWLSLDSVVSGLGGGGGETMINALWFLLISWVALQARELPRILNYLGFVTGGAGILMVVLPSISVAAVVYELGLPIWFIWLGIVMLRKSLLQEATLPIEQQLLHQG